MKKVLSGMIAAVMTICMSVSVFASPNSSVSIINDFLHVAPPILILSSYAHIPFHNRIP